MEIIFKNAIELVSDWRFWIMPPTAIFLLGLVIREIFGAADDELERWRQ